MMTMRRCFLSFSVLLLLLLLLFLCVSCFQVGNAREVKGEFEKGGIHGDQKKWGHINVKLSSLLTRDTCSTSPTGRRGGSLKVVHRDGPCSGNNRRRGPISEEELLQLDEARVESIQAKYAAAETATANDYNKKTGSGSGSISLPAKSGGSFGTGNYIVTVGLGTPKKDLTLTFDTGSDLTWTQCEPCRNKCYQQLEPKFDPSASSTYANVSCNSQYCNALSAASSSGPPCKSSSSTCKYDLQYGDGSFSAGFLATETLTLGSSNTTAADDTLITCFYFGCGHNNQGIYGGVAGLMGLGRERVSLATQLAQQKHSSNYFSYCLPLASEDSGHLTFGKPSSSQKNKLTSPVSYTPLVSKSVATFYIVTLESISVGGKPLQVISSSSSSSSSSYSNKNKTSTGDIIGTIVDSGTVITRLSPQSYSALRDAFRTFMHGKGYQQVQSFSILDTCYNFSGYDTISVPTIAFTFSGGAVFNVDFNGILLAVTEDLSQVCLAFAGNTDPKAPQILGNKQQATFEIVYDVDGGQIGFTPNAC